MQQASSSALSSGPGPANQVNTNPNLLLPPQPQERPSPAYHFKFAACVVAFLAFCIYATALANSPGEGTWKSKLEQQPASKCQRNCGKYYECRGCDKSVKLSKPEGSYSFQKGAGLGLLIVVVMILGYNLLIRKRIIDALVGIVCGIGLQIAGFLIYGSMEVLESYYFPDSLMKNGVEAIYANMKKVTPEQMLKDRAEFHEEMAYIPRLIAQSFCHLAGFLSLFAGILAFSNKGDYDASAQIGGIGGFLPGYIFRRPQQQVGPQSQAYPPQSAQDSATPTTTPAQTV